ncbi:MAG: hypothetical protein Q7U51_08780, partial [Methanoregula sp.]|nr:hypothetical protein [Methanoregula sp.]
PATPAVPETPYNNQGTLSPGIEDLFEDAPSLASVDQIPVSQSTLAVPSAETSGVIAEEEPAEVIETTDEPVAYQEADKPEVSEQGDEPEDKEEAEDKEEPEDNEDAYEEDKGDQIKTLKDFGPPSVYGISFNRQQWFDLLKWSHHSGALSHEQRMQIVRMGRLIQNGRKLTPKQDEQVREMMALVQTLGYRFH